MPITTAPATATATAALVPQPGAPLRKRSDAKIAPPSSIVWPTTIRMRHGHKDIVGAGPAAMADRTIPPDGSTGTPGEERPAALQSLAAANR